MLSIVRGLSLAALAAIIAQHRPPHAGVGCPTIPVDTLDGTIHRERVVAANDACLELLDFGGRGRLLLFLPGFGNNAHIFDDLAPTFIDRYHVVALTPRGFPPSSAPPTGYTIAQLTDDVATVMDSLGESSAILAGHSISGAVMTAFGQKYGPRLAAAVYLDAAFDFGPAFRRSHRPGKVSPSDTLSPAVRAWRSRYDNWTRGSAQAVDNEWRRWEQIDSTETARRSALVEPLATEVRSHAHEPWRMTAPILALCAVGAYDRAFGWLTPDSTRWAAARVYFDEGAKEKRAECNAVRRARLGSSIELDSGHYVFFDQRDIVVREMRAFLARVLPE
jgi:pimeloyl-ACP methyl ester carboxylesterase